MPQKPLLHAVECHQFFRRKTAVDPLLHKPGDLLQRPLGLPALFRRENELAPIVLRTVLHTNIALSLIRFSMVDSVGME